MKLGAIKIEMGLFNLLTFDSLTSNLVFHVTTKKLKTSFMFCLVTDGLCNKVALLFHPVWCIIVECSCSSMPSMPQLCKCDQEAIASNATQQVVTEDHKLTYLFASLSITYSSTAGRRTQQKTSSSE